MNAFDELKHKIVEDPASFVVILGAGASIPAGLPSWSELKNCLYDALPEVIEDSEQLAAAQRAINESRDLWKAFSRLRHHLGTGKYEREVVHALDCSNLAMPALYKQIWQLNISGIINFNLDKFAIDAYSEVHKKSVDVATGNEPHKFKNFPLSSEKFVFHPHGTLSDPTSWVFTENERRNLYQNHDFRNIITTLFNSKNLLIIGFNVDEWSFQQLITDCGISQKLNGYHNYYFCPNATADIQRELGDLGVAVIPYSPTSPKHSELNEYLTIIQNFKSVDSALPTVYTGKTYTEADIPSETDCYRYTVDKLRDILNGVVANIIPSNTTPTKEQLDNLEKFYNTYIEQLHRAWLVNPKRPSTATVYGYTTTRFIGNGAFGSVFEAEDKDGNRCALKVLSPEVKDNTSYLSCFRRGIRSMHILKEKNIDGMVKIHDSYEVPACIVMDLVDGITLRKAIDQRFLTRLEVKLSVLERISTIIYSAHQLEERILHRDLKPENIMLENCYSAADFDDPSEIPNVKVLDFDLSWHRGTTEKTVTFGAISQGFMAPEQVDVSVDKSLSRNTAVDIYSLGMLAYYVLTGNNPMPNESQFASFPDRLREALEAKYTFNWKCLPEYLCKTILKATDPEQFNRIPLDVFIQNLNTARKIYLNSELPNTHPLILMELKERLGKCTRCDIFDFGRKMCLDYAAFSKRVTLSTASEKSEIIMSIAIERYASDSDRRDGLSKYLRHIADKAATYADSKFFHSVKVEQLESSVSIQMLAYLPKTIGLQYIEDIASNILEVRQHFGS
ncbi:MAG: SIR2 family protein [Roseburia sp.]